MAKFHILKIFGLIFLYSIITINCNKDISSKIIGGSKTGQSIVQGYKLIINDGEYPYMASFRYDSKHICGAVIILPKYVLTAAHCLLDRHILFMDVRAGTYYRNRIDDPHIQVRKVKMFRTHPKYNEEFDVYDIAIIKLHKSFDLNKYVNTIKLSQNRKEFIDETALILGFGNIGNNHTSDFLRFAEVKVISNKHCDKIIKKELKKLKKKYFDKLVNVQMCTMDVSGEKGGCDGDSGGPLVIRNKNNPKEDILIGITSFVFTREVPLTYCYTKMPTVYATVAKFYEWINKTRRELDVVM